MGVGFRGQRGGSKPRGKEKARSLSFLRHFSPPLHRTCRHRPSSSMPSSQPPSPPVLFFWNEKIVKDAILSMAIRPITQDDAPHSLSAGCPSARLRCSLARLSPPHPGSTKALLDPHPRSPQG